MQGREPGARRNGQSEADRAIQSTALRRELALAEQRTRREQHQHRQKEGGLAEHQERDVGEPRAGRTHSIRDRVVVAATLNAGSTGL